MAINGARKFWSSVLLGQFVAHMRPFKFTHRFPGIYAMLLKARKNSALACGVPLIKNPKSPRVHNGNGYHPERPSEEKLRDCFYISAIHAP